MEEFDIIVIGAGPAGISAAIYSASRGKKTLLLEKNRIGGMIGNVSSVTHYAGIIAEETGHGFAKRMERQILDSSTDSRIERVVSADFEKEYKTITTEKNTYVSKAVIIASGCTRRHLGIPGEERFGSLNAARDHGEVEGKDAYVVGGADGAVKEALFLARHARHVYIIHFEEKLGAISEFIEKNKPFIQYHNAFEQTSDQNKRRRKYRIA